MTNSTYSPQRWIDIETSKVTPNVTGITSTITSGTTQNIDTLIADDSFIRSIQVIAKSATFGDTMSIKVIDIDNILGFGANTIISTPVTNFNIVSDQQKQADYESIAPFKILGGLYVRIAYTSTGLVDVSVGVNLLFLKALV